MSTFDELGGDQAWADTIGNQNKTSSHRGAPLKAVAIHREAEMLCSLGIDTTADLRTAVQGDDHWDIRREWTKVVGQRSGITWHYALMLAGVPGVKPDRMILRFVAKALDMRVRDVSLSLAVDVVTATAGQLGVSATALDHAIWQYQSGLARTQRP